MLLETERLILREMTEGDFDALYAILSDAETMKYYPAPYDEAQTRRWIRWCLESYADLGFGLYAATLKDNGKMIGDCGVTMQRINGWIRPEIGYHFNKAYHRRGYASEAAAAWRDWIFANTPFNTVYSYMTAENVASYRTALKTGMSFLYEYEDGGERLKVCAVARSEWENLRLK